MNDWIAAVQAELGLNVSFDTDSILDAARDAAHATERKAAPITTYLMGVAAAQGATHKRSQQDREISKELAKR